MRRFVPCLLALYACGSAAADIVVRVKDRGGNVVAVLTVPEGGGVEVVQPQPGPGPGPGPEPIPPPRPDPGPNPAPQQVKHVVVIRDDTPGVMTPGQLAALRDPGLRAAVEKVGMNWHVFEVHQPAVTKPKAQGGKGYLPLVQQAGGAPCLILFDAQGQLARQPGKLPDSPAGILAAVGLANGGNGDGR